MPQLHLPRANFFHLGAVSALRGAVSYGDSPPLNFVARILPHNVPRTTCPASIRHMACSCLQQTAKTLPSI